MRLSFALIAALLDFGLCRPREKHETDPPIPLVIWHGLGDRYDAEGLASVADVMKSVHPGAYVYNVRISDDGSDDQRATFVGNIDIQIDQVCRDLAANANLTRDGTAIAHFDALGFSQGGQFLRGLIERCSGIAVRNLVTFGSQHSGINQFKTCGAWDFLCKGTVAAIKGNAFGSWAQQNVIPAQYYRELDTDTHLGSELYLNSSHFLADINNERRAKSDVYKRRLENLQHFAMYVFGNDTTVIPKESGWFDEVIDPKDDDDRQVIPLRERRLYTEDWLGLRKLDDRGRLSFRLIPDAGHMQISEELLVTVFEEFMGPDRRMTYADSGLQAILT